MVALDYESGSDSNWDSDTEVFYKEDVDLANEAELKLYAKKELNLELDGLDSDLAWLAWEAFVTPPPEGWTEHVDETGRVFFHSQITNESRWSHPGDATFRSIIDVIKTLRGQRPLPSEKQRSKVLQEHLLQMHKRAEEDIKGWTGPYTAEDGGEYFYSNDLQESTWEHPHERWERELALCNAVLHRCLLQAWPKELEPVLSKEEAAADIRPLFLSSEALAPNTDPNTDEAPMTFRAEAGSDDDDNVSLCSARSCATMRSSVSLRSTRSTRSTRSMRSARSTRSTRSITPSPDKRKPSLSSLSTRPAPAKSPQVLPPGVVQCKESSAAPPQTLPPATESPPVTPLALLRTQSQSLPRFGQDSPRKANPQSDSPEAPLPRQTKSEPAMPTAHASGPADTESPDSPLCSIVKSPPAVPAAPATCKSCPPCKVPQPHSVAPPPKSPPGKALDGAGDTGHTQERRMTWASSSSDEELEGATSPERRTRSKAEDVKVASPADEGTPMTFRQTLNEEKASVDVVEKENVNLGTPGSPDKADKELSWLPQHAQRIIKRHLGTPGSPDIADKACDLYSDATVVVKSYVTQDADIAGGIPADDAAAGDAAVMALVTGKCAPAVPSAEMQKLQDEMGQSLMSPTSSSTEQLSMSPTSSLGSKAQYFNLYETDPECQEADKVHKWLRSRGLARYFEQLAAEGFDDMNILAHLEESEIQGLLEMCPMPKLHEQQLRRGLSRLRTEVADMDGPQLPV